MSSVVPNSRTIPLQPRSIVPPASRSKGDGGQSRTSSTAQQGGTQSTTALRSHPKPLSPPSPALSNGSDLNDDDDTPLSNYNNNLSPSLSYSAYSALSRNSHTPPLTPSPPTNELAVFNSGYSDSPSYTSLASVRQAILTRLPAKNESGKAFTTTTKEGILAQKMALVNGQVNGYVKSDGKDGEIEEGTESSATSFESLGSEEKGDKFAEESNPEKLKAPHTTAGKLEKVRLSTASSLESDSSLDWRRDLDDAGKDASTVDFDSRMMSFLGPKTRKLSKAPWDIDAGDEVEIPSNTVIDETPEENRKDSTSSNKRTSKDTVAEGAKLKQTLRSRTKSFGALTSRKVPAVVISRDSVEGLQGLGIDGKNGHGSLPPSPTKLSRASRSVKDSLTSPRDSSDSMSKPWSPVMIRKSSEVGAFSFPPPPLPPLPPQPASPSTSRFQKLQQRLGREVTPIVFDIGPPGGPPAPATKATPRSPPPNIGTFDLARHTSGASSNGNARGAVNSSSRSLHSLSPTSAHFPMSPPTSSTPPFSPTIRADGTAVTTPLATGYKLISLEQAREREMERVALAAQQRKAMAPVEYIAPREETASVPLQAPLPIDGAGKDGSASSSASITGVKTLKNKKSGFLKRMMGGDKTSTPATPALPQASQSVPVRPGTFRTISGNESFTSIPSNSPSPPSVSITVSSPPPTAALPALPSVTLSGPTLLSPAPSALQLDSKGNLIAPSLSLRPVSMGFLAGLPTNFLASPPNAKVQTIYEAPTQYQPRTPSPVLPPSALLSAQLPSSSTLDSDRSSSSSSTTTTPVTPSSPYTSSIATNGKTGSHPSMPSPYDPKTLPSSACYSDADHETLSEVKEQFERAKMVWESIRRDLENQVKELRSEVVRLRGGDDTAIEYDTPCSRCEMHSEECECPVEPISILSRPRFKGNKGTKSLFSA